MRYTSFFIVIIVIVIVRLLSRPDSPIILVFGPPAPVPNSKVNSFSGAQNIRGWENFANVTDGRTDRWTDGHRLTAKTALMHSVAR